MRLSTKFKLNEKINKNAEIHVLKTDLHKFLMKLSYRFNIISMFQRNGSGIF